MNNTFLYHRRIELGLSQSQIAKNLGYSTQTVSLWESGKSEPSFIVWGKYASVLKVDLNGLILGYGKKDNNCCDESTFDANKFSDNLRKLRKSKGITQAELAKEINVNVGVITRLEKGASYPDSEQFIALSKYFNISYDDLYFAKQSSPIATVTPIKKPFIKRIFLPIILPIIIVASVGVTTAGITISMMNKRSNVHIDDISSSEELSTTTDEETTTTSEEKTITTSEEGTTSEELSATTGEETTTTSEEETITTSEEGTTSEESTTSETEVRQLEYGVYPQNHVTDEALISSLNALTTTNEYGYYEFEDNYYEKGIREVHYGGGMDLYFNNDEEIEFNKTYWYKVEPITWDIFKEDENSYTLISNMLLDESPFDSVNNLNNYENSEVRSFINSEFYNKAFFLEENKPLVTEVDNSLASTGQETNRFVCNNTSDHVFLPSAADLHCEVVYDSSRTRYTTEYVRAKNITSLTDFSANYWTRSPLNTSKHYVCIVQPNGYVAIDGDCQAYGNGIEIAIRPMIRIQK